MTIDNSLLTSAAHDLLVALHTQKITPVLYGSFGLSIYLGNFKQFSDIDLIVDDELIDRGLPKLIAIMKEQGFELIDEREHEFKNDSGVSVGFARKSILLRDNVITGFDELVSRSLNGLDVTTLKPEDFLKAYQFSIKDGYRKNTRGKKDREVITLIEQFLSGATS